MKLIIQIPCHNEAESLPQVLSSLPRSLDGIDEIEWLLLNDGSTDNSEHIARKYGIDHILTFKHRIGLAQLFMAGILKCVELGADIIVNFDGDNHYCAADIEKLITPILEGRADFVVGERPIEEIENFSYLKKKLQWLGSKVVSFLSGVKLKDVTSGFRALNRYAALKLNVFNDYTYTLETLIQSRMKKIRVEGVPIKVNLVERPSRLMKSNWEYVWKNLFIVLRSFVLYRPLLFFGGLSALVSSGGLFLILRFLYFYFMNINPSGHIQSLILASILMILGGVFFLIGIASDLISFNRIILEDLQYKSRLQFYVSNRKSADFSNNSSDNLESE